MVFTTRSKRSFSQFVTTTPENVGPGSYNSAKLFEFGYKKKFRYNDSLIMNLIRKVLHHSRVLLLEIFFPLMTHFLFQALDVIIRKQKFKNENQVWVCLSQHQNDSKMAIRTRLHFQVCFIASSINQNRTWKL